MRGVRTVREALRQLLDSQEQLLFPGASREDIWCCKCNPMHCAVHASQGCTRRRPSQACVRTALRGLLHGGCLTASVHRSWAPAVGPPLDAPLLTPDTEPAGIQTERQSPGQYTTPGRARRHIVRGRLRSAVQNGFSCQAGSVECGCGTRIAAVRDCRCSPALRKHVRRGPFGCGTRPWPSGRASCSRSQWQ